MEIQKSSEDYLETMLMMQQQHGFIRSIDVAEHLGVTKPSACGKTAISPWTKRGLSPWSLRVWP